MEGCMNSNVSLWVLQMVYQSYGGLEVPEQNLKIKTKK